MASAARRPQVAGRAGSRGTGSTADEPLDQDGATEPGSAFRSRASRTVLLDTGFLIALVNGRDPDHMRCREVWAELRARTLSVEGVLVEAAHMLRRIPGGAEAAIGLVTAAKVMFVPLDSERLERSAVLMRRYRDIPMDFVDAALVAIAEAHSVTEVLSLDVRGFSAYRARTTRAFTLLPAPGTPRATSPHPRRSTR